MIGTCAVSKIETADAPIHTVLQLRSLYSPIALLDYLLPGTAALPAKRHLWLETVAGYRRPSYAAFHSHSEGNSMSYVVCQKQYFQS
jgi:hypothetical protein